MVKCLAQGDKCPDREWNPHSNDSTIRTWARCSRPLGHGTPAQHETWRYNRLGRIKSMNSVNYEDKLQLWCTCTLSICHLSAKCTSNGAFPSDRWSSNFNSIVQGPGITQVNFCFPEKNIWVVVYNYCDYPNVWDDLNCSLISTILKNLTHD